MPSAINQLIVAELARKFDSMRHALLVDFAGLSSSQTDELRGRLREQGARMLVVRNSLAVLALRQLEHLELSELIQGPTAFVCGDDPVSLSKLLVEWGRTAGALRVRGGLVAGRALDAAGVAALAALPPLRVLHAQVVSAIASPLSGFVGVLQSILRSFAGVIKAIGEKEQDKG